MRKRIIWLAAFLVFVAGLGILLWPSVNNLLTEYGADIEIASYGSAVEAKDESELRELEEEAGRYNESLLEGVSFADYNEMLAVTEAIGWLEIPKLDVYLPIYHGVEEDVLERGVGHMPGTSLPVGGPSTHCVLSGHTGLPTAKIFTDLDKLEEGDLFFIHVLDRILAYRVDQSVVVLPEETDEIGIVEGKDYVTLLTCIPYGVNSHRLLVRGERTEYTPEEISVVRRAPVQEKENKIPVGILARGIAVAAAALVLLISLLILFVPGKSKKDRKD